jgi:hypothetical protein
MNDDSIRRAHAKEIHPSNPLVAWHSNQLSELPGYDDDIDLETLSANLLARVIYTSEDGQRDPEADYDMPLPLTHESILAAKGISAHAGVFAVALYDVYDDGRNAQHPAAVYAHGELVSAA